MNAAERIAQLERRHGTIVSLIAQLERRVTELEHAAHQHASCTGPPCEHHCHGGAS